MTKGFEALRNGSTAEARCHSSASGSKSAVSGHSEPEKQPPAKKKYWLEMSFEELLATIDDEEARRSSGATFESRAVNTPEVTRKRRKKASKCSRPSKRRRLQSLDPVVFMKKLSAWLDTDLLRGDEELLLKVQLQETLKLLRRTEMSWSNMLEYDG